MNGSYIVVLWRKSLHYNLIVGNNLLMVRVLASLSSRQKVFACNHMSRRRMFSSDIVGQDNFLDMPTDSQLLYFHLGMLADDEGFVSPKRVMRMMGASEDSLKLLIAKQFVIPFESGIIVIKHWKQNNYLQKDRFTPSIYQEERQLLDCIQNVYKMYTQEGRKVGRKEEEHFYSLEEQRNEDKINAIKNEIRQVYGKKRIT